MRELVQDGHHTAFPNRIGHLGTEHIHFGECDCASVFHCPCIEFGNEQLVVLLERIRDAERVFEVGKSLARDVKDVVSVEEFGQGLANKNTQGNGAAVAACQL